MLRSITSAKISKKRNRNCLFPEKEITRHVLLAGLSSRHATREDDSLRFVHVYSCFIKNVVQTFQRLMECLLPVLYFGEESLNQTAQLRLP